MSFSEISSHNFPDFIDQFKTDFKRYSNNFEKFEVELSTIDSNLRREKLEFKKKINNLSENLLSEIMSLDEISRYILVKAEFQTVLTIDIESYKDQLNDRDNLLLDIKEISEKIRLNNEGILKTEEDKRALAEPKQMIAKVNPHILHSRQSLKPFIVTSMHDHSQYKCHGCQKTIPLNIPYLRHLEEYPAGSKLLRPHSYHISRSCLCTRGFENEYLARIRVECKEEINDNVIADLENIGFMTKNIRMNVDSGSESDGSETMSQHSGTSMEPSTTVLFVYRRKHVTQKKKVTCVGCNEEIVQDSFLTRGHSFDQPYHIISKCIRANGALSNDFSEVKCEVHRMLKKHGELKELLACGFYFKNILGNKPVNPNIKLKPMQPSQAQALNSTRPSPKDIQYILNNESFTCERLPHAERCRGCTEQIRKENMGLRHKERVPRDKIPNPPPISQFYHPERNCLIDRGFTSKYLDLSSCHVVLTGQDNLQNVRDILVRCGFSSDRLTFGIAEDTGRQGVLSPVGVGNSAANKSGHECYLFIVKCTRVRCQCEGCQLNVAVGAPCFVYGTHCIQDGKARVFHISKECLQKHFTSTQIFSMVCINDNSMVTVDPMAIVRCGLVNIMTTMPSTAASKQHRQPLLHSPSPAPAAPALDRLRFVVDTSLDFAGNCSACHQPLQRDTFVLRQMNTGFTQPLKMHLNAACVRQCGFLPPQLAHSELTFAIQMTPEALRLLENCGFRKPSVMH